MRIRGTITLPSSKKGQMRMFVLAQKRRHPAGAILQASLLAILSVFRICNSLASIKVRNISKSQELMVLLFLTRYWIHWCTTKISLPFVNWMETMKTAKRNAWQGGAQKNPAAKEMPGNCFCERRTMARTADPSE
uniref:Uncharacterized protein n=1 Tax=Oryza nivara TaxID=4536 RepID=A0A0E0HY08_ORYNI